MRNFLTISQSWCLSEFLRLQIVTFPSFLTICKRRNLHRGLKRNLYFPERRRNLLPLAPSPPHPHSPGVIPSILTTHHPPWPPNASAFPLCRARSPLLPYSTPLSLPPPGGGVVRPLRGRRSLGTTTAAATFIVVVVIVFLLYWLSCWLSCCCCPLSRVVVVATAAAATAEPSTRSGRRHRRGHLHRRCRHNHIRCSYHHCPHLAAAFIAIVDTVIAPAAALTTQIPSTQLSLTVAIVTATAILAAIVVAFAAVTRSADR